MNILYLAQRVPYPPDRGDRIATYHAVRHLAREHDVVVAALAESDAEIESARVLAEEEGVTVDAVPLSAGRRRSQALRALVGRQPLSCAFYRSPELARRVTERARGTGFDAVVVFSSSMAPYAELVDAPVLIDFADLDSQKWELYSRFTPFPRLVRLSKRSQTPPRVRTKDRPPGRVRDRSGRRPSWKTAAGSSAKGGSRFSRTASISSTFAGRRRHRQPASASSLRVSWTISRTSAP